MVWSTNLSNSRTAHGRRRLRSAAFRGVFDVLRLEQPLLAPNASRGAIAPHPVSSRPLRLTARRAVSLPGDCPREGQVYGPPSLLAVGLVALLVMGGMALRAFRAQRKRRPPSRSVPLEKLRASRFVAGARPRLAQAGRDSPGPALGAETQAAFWVNAIAGGLFELELKCGATVRTARQSADAIIRPTSAA